MRSLLALAAALVLGGASSAGAAAPATWTISGTVTNHTGTPRPVAGQIVKLTAYVDDAEQDWKEGKTDARGGFTVSVPADPRRTYALKVQYKGGEYDSPRLAFKPGEAKKTVAMRVYEPTSDAGVLKVNVHHLIVEVGDGMIQVAELIVFANQSDRTYIGGLPRPDGKRETLRFSLPAGAANLQYMEGLMECCVSATDEGMVDTMDVEPGMREIAYSYTLPVTRSQLALARRLDYPADRVEVFGSAAAQFAVTPLARQEDVRTDQGIYARFSAESVGAGTDVRLILTGLPVSRSSSRRIALAAFAGLVAAALVYPILRRSRRAPEGTRSGQSRAELIQAIAALDDHYEAGTIPADEYHRRRARYMEKLRGLAA